MGIERDVADLVDDQQRDPLQPGEFVIEAALALGVGEQRDPFGGGPERDALAGQAGANPQRDAQVGLAGAGRAEQDDVLLAGRKSSWPRCWISVFLTERWKVKSNSSSVLRAGKRAALMRPSPPCASRELSARCDSSASAKRS